LLHKKIFQIITFKSNLNILFLDFEYGRIKMNKKIIGIFIVTLLIITTLPAIGIMNKFAEEEVNILFVEMPLEILDVKKDNSEDISTVMLDQLDQYSYGDNGEYHITEDGLAQSFKPSLSKITKVNLQIKKPGPFPEYWNYHLEIRAGSPTGTLITSTLIDYYSLANGWNMFDFPDASVIPGNTYFIILYGAGIAEPYQDYWYYGTTNPYPNGGAFYYSGGWMELTGWDFCFETYGENSPPNTPSTPSGPTSVIEGIFYTYTTSTTDPDNDKVRFGFDFNNDGVIEPSHWTGLYSSGATCSFQVVFYGIGARYLRAKAEDEHGLQSGFSSALTIDVSENNPPNTPSAPFGPSSGGVGESYSYTTSTTDPDGDKISYGFDWDGDSIVDEYSGLLTSGTTCTMSHSWSSPGTYIVKVKAKDEYNALSSFSSALIVTISDNQPPNKPTCSYDSESDELIVTATDPDDDQIRYGVDWNNDLIVDQWTSLVASGTEQRINCGGRKGTVGVITEDEYGVQSDWVTQKFKNKAIYTSFFRYLNYPILNKLFQRFLQI
jgi:hypothetical protein